MTHTLRSTKGFKLEVEPGGQTTVTLDGEVIRGITSYYINKDAEVQELTIELWKTDHQGNMDIMDVVVGY